MIFDEMEKSLWNQDWVLCCAIHVYPSHQKMWDDSNTWRFSKFQIHPGKLGVVQCFFVVFLYIFGDSLENTNHGPVDVFLVVF